MRRMGFDSGPCAVIPPTFLLPAERLPLLQVQTPNITTQNPFLFFTLQPPP